VQFFPDRLAASGPPGVEPLVKTRLQALVATRSKHTRLNLPVVDARQQQMGEGFVALGTERARAIVGQAVPL
jgi:hypothetical protein